MRHRLTSSSTSARRVRPLALAAANGLLAAAVAWAGIACRARAESAGPSAAPPAAPSTPQPAGAMADPTPSPAGGAQPATALPFTRVYASTQSAYAESIELVARSADEWQRAWLNAHPNRAAAPPPPPAVDFARDMVVLVTPGTQPTGGVTVRVDSVRARGDGSTNVVYTVTRPGAGCMSTQSLTAPVEAVRVRRAAGEVHFARRDASAPC